MEMYINHFSNCIMKLLSRHMGYITSFNFLVISSSPSYFANAAQLLSVFEDLILICEGKNP